MAASPSLVREYAPEFAGLTDFQIQPMLDRAAKRVAESYFGDTYDEAVALLAAHLLKLTPLTGAPSALAGPVTSQSAGGISQTYAALAWSPSWFNLTAYGQQYQALVRSRYIGLAVS